MPPPYQRYLQNRLDAYHKAMRNLRERIPCNFTVVEISNRAYHAVAAQWDVYGRSPEAGWNWQELMRRYRDPDRLDIAIWSQFDRISALALAVTTGTAVELKFLEADPRTDCPLRGRRALIVLETAACYAQSRGKQEIRVRPINETVANFYRAVYGFEMVTKSKATDYLVKRI